MDDNCCEVCFLQKPIDNPLIDCAHRNTFCEECVTTLLRLKKSTCPKCRAVWPDYNFLNETHQNLTINSDLTLVSQQLFSPSFSTNSNLMDKILVSGSIILLVGLILYPTVMQ
ncbi:hypothetical protein I4U23_007830 [Adineta vaga]|nr:hypothetical protein I4U23_007830 [Adineta vaga]